MYINCFYLNFKYFNKNTWIIVIFSEPKDYSVVPTNWLTENDNINLSYCNWPLGRVTSTEIHDGMNPA